ncbi:DNA-binding transcriptional LysR family regulator [Achromobacter deleyi]|uniref:LysR family transcriptional regulator n=1 Tax=Achromobacter TaxID=222 RepID=UPI000CFCE29F|nr:MULTISPECIES: LysR family transcriptional regulator [Achromobacter]MDR6604434.1 DNA-binding transcriptional LysR family regulator [Achromobacter deleyi]PQZ70978.1 LysR family transcriptional regulator [Achromobacter sp. MYb9]
MNLKQLEHLLAVAEAGSFSRAADRLHLTQSALSRSVRLLEEDLGGLLLDRMGKRTELTPLGLTVAGRARRILFESAELRRSAELLTHGDQGTISIGLGSGPGAMLMTPLLTHVAQRHPQLHLELMRGPLEAHLALLRERRLDALVVDTRGIAPAADLRIEPVSQMRAGFICRRGHPLARQARPPRFAEIAAYPLASTFLAADTERILIEHFGIEPDPRVSVRLRCDEIGSLLEAVRVSDAVFLGIVGAARVGIAAGELMELPSDPPLRSHALFALVTLTGRTEAPAMALLRAFMAQRLHD